jgi:tetratricopeptide (TPR) repeat protein
MTSQRKVTESDIFLHRGLAKYELEKYTEAIQDFKKITELNLEPHKYNNLGASYFQVGVLEEAYEECLKSIKADSRLVEAYYNAAVIKLQERKYEQAHKMLDTCLNIDKNFKPAHDLLVIINKKQESGWYTWWFKNGNVKKIFGGFIVLLLLIIVVSISLNIIVGQKNLDFIFGQLMTGRNMLSPQISYKDLGMVTLVIFVLLVILLLPSIKKLKMGPYEIETITSNVGPILPSYDYLRALTSSPENKK